MDPDDLEDDVACAECGARLAPGTQRGYVLGARAALCFDCALRRGGAWDEAQDRWTRAPDLTGLDLARPGDE